MNYYYSWFGITKIRGLTTVTSHRSMLSRSQSFSSPTRHRILLLLPTPLRPFESIRSGLASKRYYASATTTSPCASAQQQQQQHNEPRKVRRRAHNQQLEQVQTDEIEAVVAGTTTSKKPSRSKSKSHGLWMDTADRRKFLEEAEKQLGIAKPEDWYRVSIEDIQKIDGARFLKNCYNGSLYRALSELRPDVEWLPWRLCNKTHSGFWSDVSNQKRFLAWAEKQLNITEPEGWYEVTHEALRSLGGGSLMNQYGGSLFKTVSSLYPDHDWLPWKFSRVPPRIWSDLANHKKFVEWAEKQLGISQREDWYKYSYEDITKVGGNGGKWLLKYYYNYALIKLLSVVYPDYEWLPWKFVRVPARFWSDLSNQRRFLDWAAKQLRVAHPDDWYKVSSREIEELGGGTLLGELYGRSMMKMLSTVYPEHEFLTWNFPKSNRGCWSDKQVQRSFFDWASKQLGLEDKDDWYKVSSEDIEKLGGSHLLRHQFGNLFNALKSVYPEHDWLPWRFTRAPNSTWEDAHARQWFVDWAEQQLNISKPEDWYAVSHDDIAKLGGRVLVDRQGSLYHLLKVTRPGYEWLPWRFAKTPSGIWSDPSNHRWFFDWAAKQLNVVQPEDWYNVSREDIVALGGNGLLTTCYQGSFSKAIMVVYPEYELLPWKFDRVPLGYWSDKANHRKFLDWAAQQLNVTKLPEDWYKVSRDEIMALGGHGMLQACYEGSLPRALAAVYSEYEWQPWRHENFVFKQGAMLCSTTTGNNNNSNDNNDNNNDNGDLSFLKRYIEYLGRKFQITDLNEWYRVSMEQIRQAGGYNIIENLGGMYAVLKRVHPEHDWREERFMARKGKRSSQRNLRVAVQHLFPDEEIFEEFYHPSLSYGDTGHAISFDLWIPSLSLAFEFHGVQHFYDTPTFGGDASTQQRRDKEKQEACERAGITLITVPYWWDQSIPNLAATILAARPDLMAAKQKSPSLASTSSSSSSIGSSSSVLAEAAAKGVPISISISSNSSNRRNSRGGSKRQED